MVRNKTRNTRQMLDVIESVIKEKYIPAEQLQMVERKTGGRRDSMACHIDRKHEEVLLCSFDERGNNNKLFPYFKEVSGFVSMSDYVLFVEDEDSLFVFSIDLKDSAHSPKQQTMLARTFAEFIINRIKTIFGESAFSKTIQYRQIGIKTTCFKTTTKAYENLHYDSDGYLTLLDCRRFYTRLLMDLQLL